MSLKGPVSSRSVALAVLTILLASFFLLHNVFERQHTPGPIATATPGSRSEPAGSPAPASAPAAPPLTNRIVKLRPDDMLASVNGHPIRLGDLIPLRADRTNSEHLLSRETYEYLLKRAVDREMILQTAKARGIELTSSQKTQLAQARATRQQPEPGQVTRLNLDQAEVDFEMRDAEAFLLQNTLLASAGASPNVTEEQVNSYYETHKGEFAELPQEETARQSAWATIDRQIRLQLDTSVRTAYQATMLSYMDRLKSGANIVMTPPQDSSPEP